MKSNARKSDSNPTLRSRLLRLVLVPLSLILLIDIVGSYFVVRHVANDVYDVELNEIAREMLLHVTRENGQLGFDLSPDAERTLLLDKEDQVYYAIRTVDGKFIAGDPTLPIHKTIKSGKETALSLIHISEPTRPY